MEVVNGILVFLKSFAFWQSLTYVISVAAILLVFVVITKPNIKFLNFSLSFFNKRGELPLFLQFKSDLEKKIYFIEYIGVMKAQMKKVDAMLQKVKNMLMENYSELLESRVSEQDTATHTDYLSYEAHVEVMLFIRVRDKVRELILDEEIAIPDMSSEGFEKFVQDTAMAWYDVGKGYLDLFYGKGHVINRDELRDFNYELTPELERCSRELLRDVKTIEIDMKKKVLEMKEQIREKEKEILGVVLT